MVAEGSRSLQNCRVLVTVVWQHEQRNVW